MLGGRRTNNKQVSLAGLINPLEPVFWGFRPSITQQAHTKEGMRSIGPIYCDYVASLV